MTKVKKLYGGIEKNHTEGLARSLRIIPEEALQVVKVLTKMNRSGNTYQRRTHKVLIS